MTLRTAACCACVLILTAAGLLSAGGMIHAAAPATLRLAIVPSESQAIYRVNEVLFREGNRLNTAVGVTNAITGEVLIDRATPANSRLGPITIDISTFRTDSPRRDRAIQERWLESAKYPLAVFTATRVEGLPAVYRDGQDVKLQVTGALKIREVTRPTTFAITVKLQGDTLTGTATTMILMTDFDFEPPSLLGILRAENEVRFELRFVARPASG